jgi:putative transcriptional regulator
MSNRKIVFRLRELMAEKARKEGSRVTYDEVYRRTGIVPSTLSAIASNRTRRVDFAVLERLCDYFSCEPGDLIVLQ